MREFQVVRVGAGESSVQGAEQLKEALLRRLEHLPQSVMSDQAKSAFRTWAEHRSSEESEGASSEFARLAAVLRILQGQEGEQLRRFERQFAITLNRYLDIVGLGLSCQKLEGENAIYDLEYFIANPRTPRNKGIPAAMKALVENFS